MKSLAVCLLVVCLGALRVNAGEIPEELKGLVEGLREKCHRETGVDIEHVDKTVEGYFHPSELLGCYFSCLFNSFDLLNHDGHIDFDKMIAKIPPAYMEHAMEMINACRHLTGKNPCDSAFNIVQCFQKTNPEKFFMI
ncbi:pheromone-binding protein-related protein 6-like [Copidosoma floridanum]|uniref:pheromone-binding protein-related protein 6-like n=1 Tax=Copidosoma floridanum TaxID=29053 RepID=UPI0006C9E5E3|nr:pheromone-binding protein-related protein 6-like [Copidosoma floridanum]